MLYRTVKTDIWRDPWFHGLNPQAKTLFLYLFTNPSVSACGSMEISLDQIAFDTRIPAKKVEAELRSFGDKIGWWPERNLLIVRNFYKHQRSQSSANFTVAAKKAMTGLPDEAKAWLWAVYPELKEGMDAQKDTHPQPIPNPSPTLGDKEEALATVVAKALATEIPSNDGTPPKLSLDDNHPPQPYDLLETLCECIGSDPSVLSKSDKGKQLAAAKRLVEGGMTLPELRSLVEFLQSQTWLTGGIDMLVVEKQAGKWRMNGRPAAPPGVVRLPKGRTWNDVEEARNRKRGGFTLTEWQRQLLEIVDGKAAA